MHAFLMVTNFLQFSERLKSDAAKFITAFVGMFFYQYIIITVGGDLWYSPNLEDCENLVTAAYVSWFTIELVVWMAVIASNVIFLFLRTCFKHKILIDGFLDETMKLPTIDTILATRKVGFSFHTEVVPFIVSNYLYVNEIALNY